MIEITRRMEGLLERRPLGLVGPYERSLTENLFPSASTLQRLGIALLFVGLLVAMGRARFYLPDNPVPITLQTFAVLTTGGVLGLRWGMYSFIPGGLIKLMLAAIVVGGLWTLADNGRSTDSS